MPNEDAPNDDTPNESNEDPSAKTQDGGARAGEPKEPGNDRGENKDSREPGKNMDQTETGEQQNQPGQEGASSRQPDRRAEDDKALQKIIELANREGRNSDSDDKSKGNDSKNEVRRPGSKSDPEREPAKGKDGNAPEPNNDTTAEKYTRSS